MRFTTGKVRKDGSSFNNEFFLAPLFDDNEKLQYFVGIQCSVKRLGPGQAPENVGWVYSQGLHAQTQHWPNNIGSQNGQLVRQMIIYTTTWFLDAESTVAVLALWVLNHRLSKVCRLTVKMHTNPSTRKEWKTA